MGHAQHGMPCALCPACHALVADKASIPNFSFQQQPNDPNSGRGHRYNLTAEFDKRITEHLGVGISAGTNNAGRDVTAARDDALASGATVNGLAIINKHPISYTYVFQPAIVRSGP